MSDLAHDQELARLADVNETLRVRKLEGERGWHFDAGRYDQALASADLIAEALRHRPEGWRTRDAMAWVELLRAITARAPQEQRELQTGFDLARTAVGLLEQGKHEEAAELFSRCRGILERLIGLEQTQTALLLKRWADNESARGNLLSAEQAYRQALDVLRSRLGELHPDVALLHNSLEVNLLRQGRLDEYERHLRHELRIRLQLDIDDPGLIATLSNLANFLGSKERYADAVPVFDCLMEVWRQLVVLLPQSLVSVGATPERDAQVRQRLENEISLDLATACQGAAENLERAGRVAEAESPYRESLAAYEKALGRDHSYVAAAAGRLTFYLFDQQRHAEAETFCRDIFDWHLRVGFGGQPFSDRGSALAWVSFNVAACQEAQGKDREALPFRALALDLRRRRLGEDHPEVLSDYEYLALNLDRQMRTADARAVRGEAAEIQQRRDAEGARASLNAEIAEGHRLAREGQFDGAAPLLRQGLENLISSRGDDHLDTAVAYRDLGINLDRMGKPSEAEPLLRKALERFERQLGVSDLGTVQLYRRLGHVLSRLERLAEAESLLQQALQFSQGAEGRGIDVAAACDGLAQCLVEQGRRDQAKPLVAMAVRLRRAAGTEHDGPLGSVALIALANGALVTVEKPV